MLGLESQDLGLVLVALIGLIGTMFAGKRGKDFLSPKPNVTGQTVEIAGAIISDKKADEIIAATDALRDEVRAHRLALDRNTTACNAMSSKIDAISVAVRDLAKEYEIASRLSR